MYKINFYVPDSHKEIVKNAMFAQGAGKIGNYSHCCWEVFGDGQCVPLEGSNAFIGEINKLEKIPEWKVEMVCDKQFIHEVMIALKTSHPYETPAYNVWQVENL